MIAIVFAVHFLASPACSETLQFTVLHTSDEHSNIMPVPLGNYLPGEPCPAVGGFARLATLVKQIRHQKAATPVILLSSGDFSGGTPFAWLALNKRAPELELMSRTGYNTLTLGNHEFDYGPEIFAEYCLLHQQNFTSPQILAANLVVPENHLFNQVKFQPSQLIELPNGLKIGIFALMGKSAHRLSPAAAPLDFSDQLQAARREITNLQSAGAEVIIALTHAGILEDISLAEKTEGIHLILGGHDHLRFERPKEAGNTLIMHSGSYLQTVGQLDLEFDRHTRKLHLRNPQTGSPVLHALNDKIAEDPEIAAITSAYLAELNSLIASLTSGQISDMTAPAAYADFAMQKHKPLCETTVGNFVADAIRLETEKITGQRVDFAIHANGIIRGDILPSSLPGKSGQISTFDLITTCSLGSGADGAPGYAIVSFYLTGAEILRMLEVATLLPLIWNDIYFLQFSGLRYQYDPNRAFWMKIPVLNKPLPAYRSIMLAERYSGEGLQNGPNFLEITPDQQLYHVATTHYMASYLPMVGKRLPRLNLVLKDRNGQPVTLDETIINLNNREFKLWEAAFRHARSFADREEELAVIPDYYRQTGGRIRVVNGPSLWLWPSLIAGTLILLLTAVLFFRRYRQKNCRNASVSDEMSV